jgi:hypothetical protein
MVGFAKFGPQNSVLAVPVGIRGGTWCHHERCVSRGSNFMWSAWPSDQNPRSWPISPSAKWIGSMYLGII